MSSQSQVRAPLLFSYRSLAAVVIFLGTCMLYMLRVNFSVAIVCMVARDNSSGNSTEEGEKLDWDRAIQGQLLSSFFFGYMLLQIPAGFFAQKFGPKLSISVLFTLATVSTLLLPPAAKISWKLVLALRILTGLGSAAMFPGLHQFWSAWAPPLERSKLVGFSYAGSQIGTIIALPLSSLLCKSIGWQYIFYIYGGLGLVWSVCWILLIHDSPSQHPHITQSEKCYIEQSLSGMTRRSDEKGSMSLPFSAVLKSLPFWAIVFANFSYDYGGYTFLTNLPTYMSDVFKFSLVANGFLSCLPYVGFYVMSIITSVLADFVQEKQIFSATVTRKIMTSVSMVLPATVCVILGFVDSSQKKLAVILLVLGISFKGAAFSGLLVNHVDIAPRYAGVLFAITNTIAAVTGLISPNVVSTVATDGTQAQWRIVLLITAGVYAVGTAFYLIFGEATLQYWAADDSFKEKKIEIDMQSIHDKSNKSHKQQHQQQQQQQQKQLQQQQEEAEPFV